MAPVKQLSDPVQIGSVRTRNRICIPPMVLYGHAGEDGMVTDAHVEHYRALAEGGAGLIIQEATCVSPEGRLRQDQLGIWAEDQVPGLKRIVEAVHGAGCPIFLQIHHGAVRDLSALSALEIESLRDAFIDGCLRACRAGYDGVELHGCHSYLLCQFLNRRTNRRRDPYADGLVLLKELYDGVRDKTAEHGVYTLAKPFSRPLITLALDWMASTRERLRKLEKKTLSVEEKMEEIRLVNRAKWLLIAELKMDEPLAHRYIEKQAMDRCISKREVAKEIIKTYS